MRHGIHILSLQVVQKCRLVTDWLSGGIKNKPLFPVLGSQVPGSPKEAVRTSTTKKNLYKFQKSLCANIVR